MHKNRKIHHTHSHHRFRCHKPSLIQFSKQTGIGKAEASLQLLPAYHLLRFGKQRS